MMDVDPVPAYTGLMGVSFDKANQYWRARGPGALCGLKRLNLGYYPTSGILVSVSPRAGL